jgi:putative transcriptional regulator
MNAETLTSVIAAHGDNRALDLLARTTHAMRADADFVARDDDVASAVFLADEQPVSLAADALNRVLGDIDAGQAADGRAASALAGQVHGDELLALPLPVRDAALEALAHDARWGFAGFGIQRLPLFSDGGAHAELMRIEPGRGVAEHDHEDEELTLVLTGAYNDGEGSYRPGDVSLAWPGFSHTPRAEAGDVCYVLVAFKGAPRFKGLFGLAQRLFGFPIPLTGKSA